MAFSPYANYELGEAFFEGINKMLVKDGIPYPKAEDYMFLSKKWRELADKPNKTPEEIQKVDTDYKTEIKDLGDSCMIYMASKVNNKSFQINLEEYKQFLAMTNIDPEAIPVDKVKLDEYNQKIKCQFTKIANHGKDSGDNLIDNKDLAAFVYALDMKSTHDANNKLTGFILNGKITPISYGVAYAELKQPEDNITAYKLRSAYKYLFEEDA